jgi:dienelactone hydrolase
VRRPLLSWVRWSAFALLLLASGGRPALGEDPHAPPAVSGAEPSPVVLRAREVAAATADPGRLGLVHGRALAQEIRAVWAERNVTAEIRRLTKKIYPASLPSPLPPLPDSTTAEIAGIAQGAEIDRDRLVVFNSALGTILCLPHVVGYGGGMANGASDEMRNAGVLARGEATSMGQLLGGVSLSARLGPQLSPYVRVFVAVPADGHPYAYVGLAGFAGALAGINARSISVSYEAFEGPPPAANAVALPFLVRLILERATSVGEAEALVRETPLTTGARVLISDGQRLDARVVEKYGDQANARTTFEGLAFGEDPSASVECFLGRCDPAVPRGTGWTPDEHLRRFLEPHEGRIRASTLRQALEQRDTFPLARREGDKLVPLGGGLVENGVGMPLVGPGTLASCVLEPQLLRLHYALGWKEGAGNAPREWRTTDLAALLGRDPLARYAPPWPVTSTGEVVLDAKSTKLGKVTLTRVAFDSPAPSGIAQNDRVNGLLYRPETVRGAVIALPAWKESNLAGQSILALKLAADGYAVLVMPLPWQVDRAVPGVSSGSWTLSDNLARTRAAFFQGAADVARASLWLEQAQGVPPARQAVMGVSLGGHVAALAYGAYPERFGAGVFLLAGGSFETALMNPNRTTGRMRKALLDRGVTPEEAKDLVEAIDGVSWAHPTRGKGVLIVGADADDVVPPANVKALAAAYGPDARLEWIPGDHYAILVHLPRALSWVVEHLGKVLPPP